MRQRQDREGIQLGTSVITGNKECEHFLITGSPGAGKSTLIRHMLTQIERRGQSAIVLDPDCEFLQEFYNEARGDVVLNPLDSRCPFWSPWLEFREESFAMDSEAMAASLIRGQARTPTEEFFRQSSRTLIEAIFQVVKDRSHSGGITEFLALPREEIQKALKGTQAYPLIDPGAHEQGAGILATAANAVKPFIIYLSATRPSASGARAAGHRRVRAGFFFLQQRMRGLPSNACKASGWIALSAG